jgi:hypothetical protein
VRLPLTLIARKSAQKVIVTWIGIGYCTTWTVDRCELAEYTDPEHKKWRRLAFMPRDLIMNEEALPFLVHWIIREDDLAGKRFDRVKTYAEDLFA